VRSIVGGHGIAPEAGGPLREFEIDIVLRAGLRLHIGHSADYVVTHPLIREHDEFPGGNARRKTNDSTIREDNNGARFFMDGWQVLACDPT
jgi:hypothetical protein